MWETRTSRGQVPATGRFEQLVDVVSVADHVFCDSIDTGVPHLIQNLILRGESDMGELTRCDALGHKIPYIGLSNLFILAEGDEQELLCGGRRRQFGRDCVDNTALNIVCH